MKRSLRIALRGILILAASLPLVSHLHAEGISEPGLILYGTIHNASEGKARLTSGTLTWRFQPSGGGTAILVSASLTNLNDQFSYVLRIPCETYIGSPISANTLRLLASPLSYDRSQVTIMAGGTAQAALVSPALSTFTVASSDRGRMERVDLIVSLPLIDSDGDGIPDSWEIAQGLEPYDPSDAILDYDGDGLNNRAEYKAGTDPSDSQSVFEIIEIKPDPLGDITIRWSSAANKKYSILRSLDLFTGFSPVQANILAVPPINTFRDAPPAGTGPYFYRLTVDE